MLAQPKKTMVVTGGAKISDKIKILKQFVSTGVKGILIGGKMANAFLLAQQQKELLQPFQKDTLPAKMQSQNEMENIELLEEINLAESIIELAEINKVDLRLPEDYKVVTDYQSTIFENKPFPDLSKELQLDLGEKTINQFQEIFKDVETVFWNGPLGAYDHPACSYYAEGSLELAKLLFQMTLINPKMSVVIGGGDSAAILNKIGITE